MTESLHHYFTKFTFQQDGTPAHWASETVQLLKQMTPVFIPPTLRPPSSPDLNPVDYAVREIMRGRVYKKKIKDVGELCQRIVEEWEQLGQRVICDQTVVQETARLCRYRWWTVWNILCDWHSDYHNGRHCRFL